MQPRERRIGLLNGLILGGLALAAIIAVNADSVGAVGTVVLSLPVALLASLAIALAQLYATALAWRAMLPAPHQLSMRMIFPLRWYREVADALLPAGTLIGQAAAARLMIRRGVPADIAAATGTIGLTIEAVSQLLFTLLGVGILLALQGWRNGATLAIGLALPLATVAVLVAVQHPGLLLIVKRLCARLSRRFPRLDPAWIDDLQQALGRLHGNRAALLWATALNIAGWLLGALELYVLLQLLGHPIGLAEAIAVESLAQTLRHLGFFLPGAAGVQEAAIVGAAAVFGVPPTTALTTALVRRTREVIVAVPGLLAWRHAESRPSAAGADPDVDASSAAACPDSRVATLKAPHTHRSSAAPAARSSEG